MVIVIRLCTEDLGGFGLRQRVVTAEYFNWHILMMTMAFLLFMTPAVAAFEIFELSRDRNKQIHKYLQTFALVCMIAGYVIIYDCHSVLSDHGLALSTHSIIGYIAIALVTSTYVMAFALYVLKFGGSL